MNPASFRVVARLGADSINVPSDLTITQIAELRAAGGAAIDFYVEAPNDLGGFVRHFDTAELIRVGAPIYLKFGLRNAPDIYPAGSQLGPAIVESARERVRRAGLGMERLAEGRTARGGVAEGRSGHAGRASLRRDRELSAGGSQLRAVEISNG